MLDLSNTGLKRNIKSVLVVCVLFIVLSYYLCMTESSINPEDNESRAPLHNDSNIDMVLKAALRVKDEPVLMTLVNDGYEEMLKSWLCNTKYMGIHKQVIIVTTNDKSTEDIKRLSPDVQVVVIDVEGAMQGHQKYSHVGYVKIMVLRSAMQLALLEYGIELYSFECDSVFFKNPVPMLHSHAKSFDMVFISTYKKPKAVCGGFTYLFPTKASITAFTELNRQMQALYERIKNQDADTPVPTDQNDQVYLSDLVLNKYAGIKTTVIPYNIIPDGKYYMVPDEERVQTLPFLIHNNWIIGNDKKIERSKKWGHWFLKEDGTCDEENIKRIVLSR